MRRRAMILLCVLLMVSMLSMSVQAVVELKLGSKMPPESIEGKAFQYFADLVKEKSDGEVVVYVYPSEQLGKGLTQIDNVISGNQDMFVDGSGFLARFEKDFRITDIPYLFRDFEHFQKVMTGPIGQRMEETLLKKGMRILNTKRNFVRGPYRVLVSKEPVKTLEDLQGLRLRTYESDLYMKIWKEIGASPIIIPWSETYMALKQNTVEAVTSPLSLVYTMRFTEVAPYVTKIKEYPQDIVFIINNNKFKSLSKEHRKILIEAANEAGEYGTKLVYESTDKIIEITKQEHDAEYIEINTDPFAKKVKDMYYKLEEQGYISEGIVDEIRNTK